MWKRRGYIVEEVSHFSFCYSVPKMQQDVRNLFTSLRLPLPMFTMFKTKQKHNLIPVYWTYHQTIPLSIISSPEKRHFTCKIQHLWATFLSSQVTLKALRPSKPGPRLHASLWNKFRRRLRRARDATLRAKGGEGRWRCKAAAELRGLETQTCFKRYIRCFVFKYMYVINVITVFMT